MNTTPEREGTAVSALRRLTLTEARLLLREPTAIGLSVTFPTLVLLGLGALPMLREPSPEFGGMRFVDVWAPTALVLGMGVLCVQHLPSVLARYRENGVLRRMSTTPVHPGMVLAAQLIVVFAATVASAALLVVSAWLVLDIEPPNRPLLFAAAFVFGSASLIALGTLVAAVVSTARAANGVSMVLYMLLMLVGGVFLPRVLLPDVLVKMGEFTPPGVQLLLEGWSGDVDTTGLPPLVQLTIMAGVAVAAALAAARLFRWE